MFLVTVDGTNHFDEEVRSEDKNILYFCIQHPKGKRIVMVI